MSFSTEILRFTGKTSRRLDFAIGHTAYLMGAKIVQRWPVGNPALWESGRAPAGYTPGHSKANWRIGVNSAPGGEIPGVDPSGAQALAAMRSAVARVKAGDVIYVVNNVPYAARIEFGNHSTQAPNGVVGIVVREFQSVVQQAIRSAQ